MSSVDYFTTKQATDRAWHMLARVYGRTLSIAQMPEVDENQRLGMLAQMLYETDPGGYATTDAFKGIEAASAAVGYPVRRHEVSL